MTQTDRPDAPAEGATPALTPVRRLLAPAVLLVLVWFLLSGGAASSWIVGAPAIAAALVLSRRLAHPPQSWHIEPAGMLRLAIFFVRESVRAGFDVARRVSARHPRISPGWVRYPCRLPAGGPARGLFVLCINLLPGTLAAAAGEHEVLIHALDATTPVADEVAALEQRVAGVFALVLSRPEDIHG